MRGRRARAAASGGPAPAAGGRPRGGRGARAGPLSRVSPSASYLTVRELLGNPHLGLELFSGSRGLERPVRCPRVQTLVLGAEGAVGTAQPDCLLAAGRTSLERLGRLGGTARRRFVRALETLGVPGLVVARGGTIPEYLVQASRERGMPLLLTRDSLAKGLSRLGFFLRNRLGAEITVNGVLVEVFGVGVLILGPSGIGKSESALELVTRGHRLIADDMVIVHRGENRSLVGSGSGLARYHMEIRGVGIIDVKELFGVVAVQAAKEIELVVELEVWQTGTAYDRLGLEERYRRMLDTAVPVVRAPVSPGRNIAVIVELAARNHLLKRQGYHTARELDRRLLERMRGSGP